MLKVIASLSLLGRSQAGEQSREHTQDNKKGQKPVPDDAFVNSMFHYTSFISYRYRKDTL